MVQRRLFAAGKQTLSSVVRHSVATVAWQLAFIPERCRVCSQCKLLLNVIHALRGHRVLVEAQNKDSPPVLLLVSRMGIHFLDHYWLMSTVTSVLFFLCVLPVFLWSCYDSFQLTTFNRTVGLHLIHWCFTPQRSPWLGCLLCGGELFYMQKLITPF